MSSTTTKRGRNRALEGGDDGEGQGEAEERGEQNQQGGGKIRATSVSAEDEDDPSSFPCQVDGCAEIMTSLLDFEAHYEMKHRNKCEECSAVFPTARLLDMHIEEHHDSYFRARAEREPMYRCLVEGCPKVSTFLADCLDFGLPPVTFSLPHNSRSYAIGLRVGLLIYRPSTVTIPNSARDCAVVR
jgi:hypothetical protein